MDDELLAELAGWYEDYLHGDPKVPATKQAKGMFELRVKKLYNAQPKIYREKITCEVFTQSEIIPDVDAYLNKNQTKFPTITPEKLKKK